MDRSILNLTLSQLARRIRRQQISSVDATRTCLAAIHAAQPKLNCFIHIDEDDALRAARRADKEIAGGRYRGPLHGVPLAHKDMFYRAGKLSTCGSKITRDFLPDSTSTVMARLEKAGAIYVGGLNMAEYCVGPTGHNDFFGHCRNPWNTQYISGGSSSGSGAAVAGRLVFGALGSDTGGSIRLPAGMCGVVGMKPTYGRVSLYGGFPRCWSLDCFGPLTRTVEDNALMLQTIAGFDAQDPYCSARPTPNYRAALRHAVKGLRIVVPQNHFFPDMDRALVRIHDEALEAFRSLGLRTVSQAIPDPDPIYAKTVVINRVEATAIHEQWIKSRRSDYNLSTITRVADGFDVAALDYAKVLSERPAVTSAFVEQVFGKADVLFVPVLPIDVPTITDTAITKDSNVSAIIHKVTQCTRWVSYLGLPALVLPCGISDNGLPVAFQLIGRPFSEEMLYAIGSAYQRATKWHTATPAP